ncbi:hypothetical protein [Asaia platycodi]|uniref:hypothetical protein n=1 Tax=Asaia platycodi TaxID=610243 RepID=UPI000471075D|nr:hypothetical protein [Asaia platycodi]
MSSLPHSFSLTARSFGALCLIGTALSTPVRAATAEIDAKTKQTATQPAKQPQGTEQKARAANYAAGKEKAGREDLTVIGKSHPLLTGSHPIANSPLLFSTRPAQFRW